MGEVALQGERVLMRTFLFLSSFLLALSYLHCDSSSRPVADVAKDADISDLSDVSDNTNNHHPVLPVDLELTEQDRFIIAQDMGHLAFPSLARLEDGRLLLVYRQGDSHVDATGRIMKQFGTADGRTWSAPEVLYDEPDMDDRDPSVARLQDGRLIVTYFQYRGQRIGTDTIYLHETFQLISTDDGETFSGPVQITPGVMEAPEGTHLDENGRWAYPDGKLVIVHASSAPLVETPEGLILPNYGGNAINLNNIAGCLRSTISLFGSLDGGNTWDEVEVLPGAVSNVWLQEPSLVRTFSGRLVMQIRTAYGTTPSTPGDLAQTVSLDGGRTWSPWKTFSFVGHAPDLIQLDHGALLSGFREINREFTNEWVSLMVSCDEGSTWSTPLRVEDCGAVECGYPSFAQLDDFHFLMVYYGPGGASITGVVFQAVPVYAAD